MPCLNNVPDANHTPIVNVPTSNRFATLEHEPVDQNDNAQATNSRNNKNPSNKRVHCPPITVMKQDARQIRNLLRQNNIPEDEYHTKGIRGGLLVVTKLIDTHKKITEIMRANSLEFFTHQLSSEVPLKIVLSGLPPMDVTDLKEELDLVGVKPTEIKAIPTTSKDFAPYLLHFANGTVRLHDLQKIRFVYNSVVRWKKFVKTPGMAIQCYRCQRYGHGSKHCNLTPMCVKCGQTHLTENCNVSVKDGNAQQTREQLKCANCGGNHTASYKGCKSRKTYLQHRLDIKTKRKAVSKPFLTTSQKTASQSNENRAATTINSQATTNSQTNDRGERALYSQVVRNGTSTTHLQNTPSVSADLFTIAEFMTLARDLFFRLRRCKSKEDQFFTLSELMIQYIYNGK